MSPTRPIPDRDDVLRALKRLGPSTVADLMRAEGGDRGARRHYRQLIRVLMRDGILVLDRKGRLSVAKARLADEGRRGGGQGLREGKRAGRAGGGASIASGSESGWGADGEERPSHRRLKAVPGRMSERPIARFDGHRDGFGFVNPTDGSRDVFIPPHRTGGALHGDLVEYSVLETRPDGRRDGSVLRVVRPTGERIVGLVTKAFPRVEVTPFDSRAGFKFFLEGHPPPGLEEGAAVEIEIPRGTGASARPARLLEVIGPITTPGVDIEVLIRKHHLRVEFPEAVLRETDSHGDEVPQQELSRRRDFSRDVVFTIDGDTAKDFDDAVSVALNPRGGYDLSVHIADVAHYVRPGSATDIEARQRGTSVYFPGRAIPMLPPALSENLCSLRPQVARLVQSVLMTFDARGELTGAAFEDGWIRSRARLTYGRVNALLGGAAPSGEERHLLPHLLRMQELALLLQRRRAARGGLDFDLPEPEVVLDALGAAAGVRPASRGPAQRLIEEFMIAANIAVARHLDEREFPVLHRVHERPDPVKVAELARVARALGHDFTRDFEGAEPSDFRGLLDRIAGTPEERPLSRLLLRTMALARYAPESLGHFGLATPDYLHFTSPIRRYPDLVAHRSLRAVRALGLAASAGRGAGSGTNEGPGSGSRPGRGAKGAPKERAAARALAAEVAHEDLEFLGAECSRLERTAEGAERESLAWKRAEVLLGRLGDEMNGTVSSIGALGVFVELEEVYAEGLVPVAALPPDRYVLDRAGLALSGERSGRTFRSGQPLRVIIARVDRIGQRVELALPRAPGDPPIGTAGGVAEYPREKDRAGRGAQRRPAKGRRPGRKRRR